MARCRYATPEDLPPEHRHRLASIVEKDLPAAYQYLDADSLNLNRAIAHTPTLLAAFQAFVSAVWDHAGVTPYQRELISLTVIRAFESEYEWNQHVRVALTEGLSPDEIRAVSRGEFGTFGDAEAALMRYVAAYARRTVDDATHERLAEQFDESAVVGITMAASVYAMTCHFAPAMDLDLEAPFVGWELEHL